MATVETVKIVGDSPEGYVVINKSDFKEGEHTVFVESDEPAELKGKLPEDFPGHAALAEAGINTYGQLRKVSDLTAIAGIGEATAAKILETLGNKE